MLYFCTSGLEERYTATTERLVNVGTDPRCRLVADDVVPGVVSVPLDDIIIADVLGMVDVPVDDVLTADVLEFVDVPQ
jgi:hypothetical protein